MWTWLNRTAARIRALFRTKDDDNDFSLELESHLAMLTEDKIREGLSAKEARRQAHMELGGLAQLEQAHRETRRLPFVDTLTQDLRYTFRTLRRDKAFAIFAILIIGIGIGASTTVLSVINTVLLRPLPFAAADRLVWIANAGDKPTDEYSIQSGHFPDLRDQMQSFADLAAYSPFWPGEQILTRNGESERLKTIHVSENFFPFLGVNPMLGRQFTTEESQFNGPKTVLMSYQFWQRRFASDPAIVGQTITLNDAPVMVAGILPASFNFTTVFEPGGQAIDIFAPFPMSPETSQWGNSLKLLGRLKPGVSIESARAEFATLGKQLTQQHPKDRNPLHPVLTMLAERVNGRFRFALLILAWAVGAVMLIVCANLSNLQLSRMAARRKEMAIRIALGAGRGRLIRQLLTESVALSCCGAVFGFIFSIVATRALAGLTAFNIPLLESVRIDAAGFWITVLIAVATGIIVGLAPALQVPVLAVYDDLKDGGRGNSGGKRLRWIRGVLVVSEVAFAFVLLVGAGLLIQSFIRVLDVDLGFQPDRAAALRIDPSTRFPDQPKRHAYYEEALRQVKTTPGVEGAALADVLPLDGDRGWQVGAKGVVYDRNQPEANIRVVSEGYFQTMGVPLRTGRDFTEYDGASSEPVVIINETLAQTLWPGQNPIGQMMTQDGGRRVIGVVGDVRHVSLEEGFTNEMYMPIRQTNDFSSVDVIVRSSLPAAEMSAGVRAALKQVAPNLPNNEWRPLRRYIDKSVSPRRFIVMLIGGFSAFALILASLGIYGVVSYSVNQRTQEIGIRMALGASARDLQGRVLYETLRLASVGIVIGFAVALEVGQMLISLLFDLKPTDPFTLIGTAILLLTVAAAAGYLPARRASRINPIIALRAN